MTQEVPTNKISIYLIKEKYSSHKDILNDFDLLQSKIIDGVGVFYFGKSHKFTPSWVESFFGSLLEEEADRLFSATSKAILLIDVSFPFNKSRIFAIPFGYGWTLLNHGTWEERFGLRTTMNIVDPNNLRKIDKKNMSSVPKDSSEQLSREGVVSDFGIDIEQDLIRSVTGKTKIDGFGKIVTGKDALSLSAKVNLSNIKELLINCFISYESDNYKENFGWIDQIFELKDINILGVLNSRLVDLLKSDYVDNLWMSVPEIIDWEKISGFSYEKKKKDLKPDILLSDFISSLSLLEKGNLSIDVLDKKIYCFDSSNDEILYQWKAFNCLYCEIQDASTQKTCILSNGKWYEVENNFTALVNSEYRQLRDNLNIIKLPVCNCKNEYDYNLSVAKNDSDFCCMDRKTITYGGGYSKIEFCDLYTKDKKIIHVKQYGGSAVLSHLFSQGIVSGELFLSDSAFRIKVNENLANGHKLNDPIIKPNPLDYQIIFAIISSSPNDLEIPFFSKVNLRNAKRRLETYGYNVSLQKINIE